MSIASLGYVVIEASDLEAWRSYACQVLGLMENQTLSGPEAVYFRADDRPFRLAVVKGTSDKFAACGWELASASAYEGVLRRLQSADIPVTRASEDEAKARCVSELARAQDPAGNQIELYYGREVLDRDRFISPTGVPEFITGNMGMGHAVLPAANLPETLNFYLDVLGFEVTDQMDVPVSPNPEDPTIGLYFLHCDNPRHHSLALFGAPNPAGCIHIMFEVPDIDYVGFAMDAADAHGVKVVSTLGRHANDNMLSVYFASPGGFAVEYGCDGAQVDWSTYVPTKSTTGDLWGHKYDML